MGNLGKIIGGTGFKKLPKVQKNCQIMPASEGVRAKRSIQRNLWLELPPGSIHSSVTRLGDLLHFGQLFKAFGNNLFAQISHILRQFL